MNTYEKYGLKPYGALPNERQLEWYKREKMAFFHFGMNTFTDREWGDGSESPLLFAPTELDMRQWIKTVKDAGFGAAILTAKHHDGFCLWPTKYTEHSVKNSSYKSGKGDIVREFTDACREFGIKAGIYLSPWDRHEKSWGTPEYNDFYVGQLTELLTDYGEIWECWWDGAGSTEAVYDWERWAKTVRKLQPKAVIFGSLGATPWVDVRWVGNEKGVAGKPCYSTIEPSSLVYEITSELNSGKIGASRFIPAEVDVSIRPGWFYHSDQDGAVRTPENLLDLWFTSNGSNAGFLLNIPPDRRGLLHENDVSSLLSFGKTLSSALSDNLLRNAKITASSERSGCKAENLLKPDSSVYAPVNGENTPELIIELEGEARLNSFMLSEAIELGQRITGVEISALVNGEWKSLVKSKCVGYKLCERFEAVKTRKLKINITSSLDTPVLSGLGAYYFEKTADGVAENHARKNLADSVTAVCEINGNVLDLNLGGVYPFNTVRLTGVGECSYTLEIFNGSTFEALINGKSDTPDLEIFLSQAVDWAYRLKITLDTPVPDNTKIEIYNL